MALGYKDSNADPYDFYEIFFPASDGLYSTVEDLYLWDQALYTEQLVPKALLDEMFTPWVSSGVIQPEPNYDVEFYNGYGWTIKKDYDYTKNIMYTLYMVVGNTKGYFCFFIRDPANNLTEIYLFNLENFGFDLNTMFQIVGEKLTPPE